MQASQLLKATSLICSTSSKEAQIALISSDDMFTLVAGTNRARSMKDGNAKHHLALSILTECTAPIKYFN